MTALLVETVSASSSSEGGVRFARWPARAGALLIDVVPGIAVVATMALLAVTASARGWLWWVFTVSAALAVVVTLVNRTVLPAVTGWTLGRAVFGIRVVARSGATPSIVRLVLRDVAHLLDTAAVLVGWLWPLWDGHRRTFADLLLRTEVRVVERTRGGARRRAGSALLIAALLCAAASGLGYQQIYRKDRAVEQAREQIAEQGPRLVERLLSYGKDTAKDDFARAQGLATDSYRPQLIAQQQAVEKAGVATNEYWAVSSAVIDNTATHAAMLLALQGQRGDNPNDLKFITATVRVEFDRAGDDWRVALLSVLKKPQLNGAAP